MIFTKTQIEGNKVKVLSEYQAVRLVRKAEKTLYFVARCLANSVDPTVVDTMCYVKHTVADENKERFFELFNNEVTVHKHVEASINDAGKHFAKLHDSWCESGPIADKFTIVTKYEQFGDLHTFVQFVKQENVQLTQNHLVYILNNILKATYELHSINIIHRDIKPHNIYIDEFFQVKLANFGCALMAPNRQSAKSSQVVGSYGFMSPDFFESSYSFEVDVWAIGVVHYFLIYLVYPYSLEKQNYRVNVKKRLKGIENENKHSQKFSERMKNFMKRFFRPRDKRQSSQTFYQFQFLHTFRITEIGIQFRKTYQTFMGLVNDQFVSPTEKYILQNNCIYHERIQQVIHYPKWGYFFFLSNLKTLAYFNNKASRTYPDSFQLNNLAQLNPQDREKEQFYRKIITFVYQQHFQPIQKCIQRSNKIFIKKMDCGIAGLIQCKNTLVIKLKSECENLKKKEERQRVKAKIMQVDERYKQFPNLIINDNKLDYQNHTIQIFFTPQKKASSIKQQPYITYKQSLILNNSMLKTVKKPKPISQANLQKEKPAKKQDKKIDPNKQMSKQAYSQNREQENVRSFHKLKRQSLEKPQDSDDISQRSKSSMKPKAGEQDLDKGDKEYEIRQQKRQEPKKQQKKPPSQRMGPVQQQEQVEIVEQKEQKPRKKAQESNKNVGVKQKERKNRTNKRRMNMINKRTKSLNKYGRYQVKKTGRPNIRIPFKKPVFEMRQVKKEDYFWLVDKEKEPELTSFIDIPLHQQILIEEIVDHQEDRYKVIKYPNLQSVDYGKDSHRNMLHYTKQLLSMMLYKKRQEQREEEFIRDYLIQEY